VAAGEPTGRVRLEAAHWDELSGDDVHAVAGGEGAETRLETCSFGSAAVSVGRESGGGALDGVLPTLGDRFSESCTAAGLTDSEPECEESALLR